MARDGGAGLRVAALKDAVVVVVVVVAAAAAAVLEGRRGGRPGEEQEEKAPQETGTSASRCSAVATVAASESANANIQTEH